MLAPMGCARRWQAWGLALACLWLSGCGDETTTSSATTTVPADDAGPQGCAQDEVELPDGTCLRVGLQESGCAPGETLVAEACVPAGVPPTQCGVGFAADEVGGCVAILPAEACSTGQLALPGEEACHEVVGCGDAPWGDIPTEADTQHVDASYGGGASDGSAAHPWTSIQQAIDAAADGAIVAIATGSYAEDLRMDARAVRLWGRCPAMVELVGSSQATAAIQLGAAASGSEVHGLAVRGEAAAIEITGASAVALASLWLHDTVGRGVSLAAGAVDVTLTDSLVEHTTERGVYLEGAELVAERVVVRDTQPGAADGTGRGLNVRDDPATGARGSLELRDSVVELSHEAGLMIHGSDALLERTLIRDTRPSASGTYGRGVIAQALPPDTAPSNLIVRQCVLERNIDGGIVVTGSRAVVESTVVRDTAVNGLSGDRGYGIAAQLEKSSVTPSDLEVRGSLLERNAESGVMIAASHGLVESTLVRDTRPTSAGVTGRGISFQVDPTTGLSCDGAVRYSVVDGCSDVGLVIASATVTVEGCVVRRTSARTSDGTLGRGIVAQHYVGTEFPTDFVLRSSLVEQSTEIGVFVEAATAEIANTIVRDTAAPDAAGMLGAGVWGQGGPAGARATVTLSSSLVSDNCAFGVAMVGADLTIERSQIRATEPEQATGQFGDGLALAWRHGPSSLTATRSRLSDHARAAISSFGSSVTLGDMALDCNVLDLVGEPYGATAAAFTDLTGNWCGCGAAEHPCQVVSAGLAPPEPVGGAE